MLSAAEANKTDKQVPQNFLKGNLEVSNVIRNIDTGRKTMEV